MISIIRIRKHFLIHWRIISLAVLIPLIEYYYKVEWRLDEIRTRINLALVILDEFTTIHHVYPI